MTDDVNMEPPNPELRALYEAEAEFPEEPAQLKDSVRKRIGAIIPVPLPPGGGSGGDGSSGTDPSQLGDAASPAGELASAAAEAAPAIVGAGLAGAKLAAFGAAMLVTGALGGAGIYATLIPVPEPTVVEVPAALRDQDELHAEEANEGDNPNAPVVVIARPPRSEARMDAERRPSSPMAELPESTLAQERAVIDVARTAVARGHTDSALQALRRHASEFPRGQLREERESLWIIALVRGGRAAEARARAVRFHRRYPRSAFGRAIDRALESQNTP